MNTLFDILMKEGNSKLAIRYAKRIIKDNKDMLSSRIAPGTKVYALVEELTKYLSQEEQKRFVL